MPSARKKRIRKLIRSYLNRIQDDGTMEFGTKELRIAEMDRIKALPKGSGAGSQGEELTNLLGFSAVAGEPTVSDVDGDGVSQSQDFAPFDATETRDTEGHGKGDNHTIVDLYNEIVTLKDDLIQLEVDATTQEGIVAGQKTIYDGLVPGPTCAAAYTAALNTATTANNLLIGYATSASEKLASIDLKIARIDALPEPDDSLGDFNTPNAQTIWDSAADDRRAEALIAKDDVDVLAGNGAGDIAAMQVNPC
jgi:hypothetical protein